MVLQTWVPIRIKNSGTHSRGPLESLHFDFTILLSHTSMTYVDLTVSMAELVLEIHNVV